MLITLKSRAPKETRVYLLEILFSILALMTIFSIFSLKTKAIEAEFDQALILVYDENEEGLSVIQGNTLRPLSDPSYSSQELNEKRRINVFVTAYSSTPCQTNGDPFITASGTSVRDGIVATNLLPFGTKIRIPQVYGDKIFVVEDRMHPRNSVHVDVWFSTYWAAKSFGVKRTYIEILE